MAISFSRNGGTAANQPVALCGILPSDSVSKGDNAYKGNAASLSSE